MECKVITGMPFKGQFNSHHRIAKQSNFCHISIFTARFALDLLKIFDVRFSLKNVKNKTLNDSLIYSTSS